MTRGARLDVTARQHSMLAAAAAHANAHEIRCAMRQRKRRAKTRRLIACVALAAKRLLIVARKTIGLPGAKIQAVGKQIIQLVHILFDRRILARRLRPIFRHAAQQITTGELRRGFGVTRLAEIIGVAGGAITRGVIGAHQALVLLRPIRHAMRQGQHGFHARVAGLAGVRGFHLVVAGIAGSHGGQISDARRFRLLDAGVAGRAFELLSRDMLFMAEHNIFAVGQGKCFEIIDVGVAEFTIVGILAFDFRMAAGTFGVFGKQ